MDMVRGQAVQAAGRAIQTGARQFTAWAGRQGSRQRLQGKVGTAQHIPSLSHLLIIGRVVTLPAVALLLRLLLSLRRLLLAARRGRRRRLARRQRRLIRRRRHLLLLLPCAILLLLLLLLPAPLLAVVARIVGALVVAVRVLQGGGRQGGHEQA